MQIDDALLDIINRPCLGAIAQPETDGDLLLHFGEWQFYEDPPDPRLLTSERGKWSLMIHCPWRLDSPTSTVCDWRSVSDPEQESAASHLVLEGLMIEAVELHRPGLDLELRFAGGYRIKSLCDSEGKSGDCWYLLLPDGSSLVATRDHRLVREPPTSPTQRHAT